jgi:hypothetical protein
MQKKRKTSTRIPGTRIRPEYSSIYRVVLAPYSTRIRSYSIRVLPISVPNIKLPESVSEKTGICTIRIRYPTGIPNPFSPLPTLHKPRQVAPSTVPRRGTHSCAWFILFLPCLNQFGLAGVRLRWFAAPAQWLVDSAQSRAPALVRSVPLTPTELVKALGRLNPPSLGSDSLPELPDLPGAPPLCRSPISSPVLAAGVLPASSSDLLHLFQTSPATQTPPRSRLPRLRRLRRRGGSNAGHRAVNPRTLRRNRPSPIQRFGSADIGPRPRALP